MKPSAAVHALVIPLLCLGATSVWARANGIASSGCDGCHQGGTSPQITLQRTPLDPTPGEVVTLEVAIQAVNGNVGGLYLRSNGVGAFKMISGELTRLLSPTEVTHSAPKSASSGQVKFRVQWTAPSAPGGVDFDVFAISANGSNSQSGDGAGDARMSFAYGCTGTTYFRDFDRDGVGSVFSGTTVNCAPPPGYSALDGDCNDSDERTFPGNAEVCNGRDDNCDGQIDEGLAIATFYTDRDGDGHGTLDGPTTTGCAPRKGFAAVADDCDDANASRYPGAPEVCNFVDDNCDGRVDEGARVVCGVGMCARYGSSCELNLCTPGEPTPETCNALDEDCDGVVDNDAPCSAGLICHEGLCIEAGAAPPNASPPVGGCASAPGTLPLVALALMGLVLLLRE